MKAMTLAQTRPVSPRKLAKSAGVRKSRKCQPDTTADELDTMELLFEKLVQMLPNIPKDRKISRLEILQFVIEYIQDLEAQMDYHPDAENLCTDLNYLRISFQCNKSSSQ